MDEIHVDELNKTFTLNASSEGSLIVTGWDKSELKATADGEDVLTFEMGDESATLESSANVRIRMPSDADLAISSALGEVIIKGLTGSIDVEQVAGGLVADRVNTVNVGQVSGHLSVKRASGRVSAEQVGAIAHLKAIGGPVELGMVSGHLNMSDLADSASAQVSGNANLTLAIKGDQIIDVSSQGAITCRLHPESDATVTLDSSAATKVKFEGVERTSSSFTLGEGRAALNLKASGPITVIENRVNDDDDDAFDFTVDIGAGIGDLGESIAGSIHEQLAAHMTVLEDGLEAQLGQFESIVGTWPLSDEDSERVSARVQKKISRAQDKVRRAKEKAARRVERAERKKAHKQRQARIKGDIAFGGRSWNFDTGGKSRKKAAEPVSDEERMTILSMLADKKISLEEAEKLLSALEGN
jgi:hypothetical protein